MATPQELARSELQKRSTYVGQDMKPFESTVNPFNPNFRASVGSAIREFIDDFGFSGGYKQGLENLSDATEFSLDFIPGVGDAVGVGDLRQSISSGDRLGMGIDGAAVALGTIPIAGDVLAKGLKKGESALRNFASKDLFELNPEVTNADTFKSRNTLITLTPDEFLNLSPDLMQKPDPKRLGFIEDAIAKGKKLDAPFLYMTDKDGVAKVTGHEGRHRALALKKMGINEMPVILKSDRIRWGQQNSRFDKLNDKWPTTLEPQDPVFFGHTQTGKAIPFPVPSPIKARNKTGGVMSGGISLRNIGGDIPVTNKETQLLKRPNDFAGVNSMKVKYSKPELTQVPIARAEDLIDRAYMTGITDTSRSGLEIVEEVNGIPINAKMRGGAYWGYQPEQIEKKQAFASAEGAIAGQLNRANLAQKYSDREGVVFVPHGMVGSSPDFATMSVDVAVPYAKQVLSNSDKKFVDKQIREGKKKKDGKYTAGIKDWVGIDNASEEYLASLGGKRKIVLNTLDDYRYSGALDLSQVRAIVTDPDQFDQAWGSVNAFYELDPKTYMEKSRVQGISSQVLCCGFRWSHVRRCRQTF